MALTAEELANIRKKEMIRNIRLAEARQVNIPSNYNASDLDINAIRYGGEKGEVAKVREATEKRGGYDFIDKWLDNVTLGASPQVGATFQAALGQNAESDGAFNYGDDSFMDRRSKLVKARKLAEIDYDQDNPMTSLAAEITAFGNVAGAFSKLGLSSNKLINKFGTGFEKSRRALTNITDVAAISAIDAAAKGKDKSDAALIGGGAMAGLSLLPPTGKGIVNFMFNSKYGKKLWDESGKQIPLTLAAEEGSFLRHLYQRAVGVAYGGKKVVKQSQDSLQRYLRANEKANHNWNIAILQKSAPEGVKITAAGHKGIKQLKNAYKTSYKDAWQGSTMGDAERILMINNIKQLTKTATPDEKISYNKILKNLGAVKNRKIIEPQQIDRVIRKQQIIANAKQEIDLIGNLKVIRADLRSQIPLSNQNKLKVVDSTYGNYKVVDNASRGINPLQNFGRFTPKELLKSVKTVGKDRTATASAPLQSEAARSTRLQNITDAKIKDLKSGMPDPKPQIWTRTLATAALGLPFGKVVGAALAPVTLPFGAATASALATKPVQRILTKQTGFQKEAAKLAARHAAALRNANKGGGINIGMSQNDDEEL